jgi:AGZA family xanthine/uracil permease-like MFS transporter
MLNSFFQLTAQQTTVRTEVLGGFTTFLTMAYITFVNPAILAEAGMDFGAVFVATCVAAAVGSLIMGLWANYPIALAPGMGLNAYFTYDVVLTQGHGWPVALGAVFVSGLLFVMLSVLPVREWIINSIPRTLKLAISAGIGLFLAVIALRNAGVVVSQPVTMLGLGELRAPGPLLALIGFVCILALYTRKVPGAVVIGILVTTALGVAFGVSAWKGFASLPPDPRPTLWQLDLAGALTLSLVPVVFSFLFIDLFDTAGTLVGVSHRAGLLDARGRLPRVGRALLADSTATVVGAALGTSTTTSYIERSQLRDRARAALRRLPDGTRAGRGRLGGRDRVRARGGDRHGHAAHLLDRRRHRHRVHRLRRSQARERQGARVPARRGRDRAALRGPVRPALSRRRGRAGPYVSTRVGGNTGRIVRRKSIWGASSSTNCTAKPLRVCRTTSPLIWTSNEPGKNDERRAIVAPGSTTDVTFSMRAPEAEMSQIIPLP